MLKTAPPAGRKTAAGHKSDLGKPSVLPRWRATLSAVFRPETREDFPALTGLRAIAAYLVFFHHYTPDPEVVGLPVHKFLREGHVGVTVFFVLSGFLITWNYFEKASVASGNFWGPYILKRVARIQPVYLAVLLAFFCAPLFNPARKPLSEGEILLNVTLLKGFFNTYKFSAIMQSWSLTVEEVFYLSAPLLFVLIRRAGIGAAQALLWITGLLLLALGMHVPLWGFLDDPGFVILYTFFGRSFEFVAGIVAARWLLSRDISKTRQSWAKCTYVGILGSVLTIWWMSSLQAPMMFGVFFPLGMALNNLVLPVFISFTILGLILETSLAAGVLSTPLFLVLGRSSYAFYLVHMGVIAEAVALRLPAIAEVLRILLLFVAMNILNVPPTSELRRQDGCGSASGSMGPGTTIAS